MNAAGAVIEIRLDSPDGKLIGETEKIVDLGIDYGAEFEKIKAAWEKGGKKGPEPNYWAVRYDLKPKFTIPINTEGTGQQPLYFVFKNPEVVEGQILVEMNFIQFKSGQAVVQ